MIQKKNDNTMNKNMKRIFPFGLGLLLGIALGVLFIWLSVAIEDKNEEIASLQEKLSQEQSDRLKDILRFGQWKLQVEQLAEKNGWILPEMSDSLVLMVKGPTIESHMVAEQEGDSFRIKEMSTRVVEDR